MHNPYIAAEDALVELGQRLRALELFCSEPADNMYREENESFQRWHGDLDVTVFSFRDEDRRFNHDWFMRLVTSVRLQSELAREAFESLPIRPHTHATDSSCASSSEELLKIAEAVSSMALPFDLDWCVGEDTRGVNYFITPVEEDSLKWLWDDFVKQFTGDTFSTHLVAIRSIIPRELRTVAKIYFCAPPTAFTFSLLESRDANNPVIEIPEGEPLADSDAQIPPLLIQNNEPVKQHALPYGVVIDESRRILTRPSEGSERLETAPLPKNLQWPLAKMLIESGEVGVTCSALAKHLGRTSDSIRSAVKILRENLIPIALTISSAKGGNPYFVIPDRVITTM